MPVSDYRNSLGYIALQLKAAQQQRDQQAKFQADQFDRQAAQQDKQMSVQSIDSAFKNYNAGEDRKIALAGLMQRSSDSAASKKALQDDKQEFEGPFKQLKADVDQIKADAAKTRAGKYGENIDSQVTERGNKEEHEKVKENQQNYHLLTERGGLRFKNPFAAPSVEVGPDGLPVGFSGGNPGETEPIQTPSRDTVGAPVNAGPNPTSSIKSTPADKTTIDAAMKAVVQSQLVHNAFKRAKTEMGKVGESDYGSFEEPTFIGVPKGIPGVGGIGINVPGNNQLEKGAINAGLAGNKAGRKLIQFLKGDLFESDPGEAALRGKVEGREVARSAAQDLSSQIGLLRLGTTSTAAQDARIDRILGMMNDKQFGQDKQITMTVLGEMEKESDRLMRLHKYIAENHALPLEDLPDVDAQSNAPQAVGSITPGQKPADETPAAISPEQLSGVQANRPAISGNNFPQLLQAPENRDLVNWGRANPGIQRTMEDFFRKLGKVTPEEKGNKGIQHLRELYQQSQGQ